MKTKIQGDLNAAMADLADAFLRWPVPTSVCADLCATKQGPGRVGTNLLSYVEARQMMDEVVRPVIAKLSGDMLAALQAVIADIPFDALPADSIHPCFHQAREAVRNATAAPSND